MRAGKMTVPVIEVEERLLRVTDAFGRLLDPQTGREKTGYPGYASPSRRVIWDTGKASSQRGIRTQGSQRARSLEARRDSERPPNRGSLLRRKYYPKQLRSLELSLGFQFVEECFHLLVDAIG